MIEQVHFLVSNIKEYKLSLPSSYLGTFHNPYTSMKIKYFSQSLAMLWYACSKIVTVQLLQYLVVELHGILCKIIKRTIQNYKSHT